jgi:hypothetical protein
MITELHPLLVQPLIEYLGEGRPALLRAAQCSTPVALAASLTAHRYVFVNRSGRPFSAPSWTQLVQGVFERETGRRIGNNLLRHSFVTHVYAGDVSDRLKHALAEHMSHRPQTAERVYNRMPGVERRRPALELASQLALGLGTAGSGATAFGTAAPLGGSGMNSWTQPPPRYSSSTSAAASRTDNYSSEEEELALDDDEEVEVEHESTQPRLDRCLSPLLQHHQLLQFQLLDSAVALPH